MVNQQASSRNRLIKTDDTILFPTEANGDTNAAISIYIGPGKTPDNIFLSFCIKNGSAPLLNGGVLHIQSVKSRLRIKIDDRIKYLSL